MKQVIIVSALLLLLTPVPSQAFGLLGDVKLPPVSDSPQEDVETETQGVTRQRQPELQGTKGGAHNTKKRSAPSPTAVRTRRTEPSQEPPPPAEPSPQAPKNDRSVGPSLQPALINWSNTEPGFEYRSFSFPLRTPDAAEQLPPALNEMQQQGWEVEMSRSVMKTDRRGNTYSEAQFRMRRRK